jgi:nitroreductase
MVATMEKCEFFTVVNDRHSVKKYDPSHVMSTEEVRELIDNTQKAPSAWNLQHWKFLIIDKKEQKDKVLPIAYGQDQVVTASIVVCILADTEANKNAEPIFSDAVENGYMTQEIKDNLIGQIEGAYQIPDMGKDQGIMNSSLAAMQLMLVAKAMNYDTCPMGGFDRQKMIETFNIPARYIPTMLITVGKGTEPAHPSSRFSFDEITVFNTF